MSSNVKVKGQGQGHQGQKTYLALLTPQGAYEWYALAANSVQQQRMGSFRGCQGVFSGACMQCKFGESPFALVSKSVLQLCRLPVLRRRENQQMLSSLITTTLI